MIVVSDTSPLSSLYLIGQVHLLPKLFGKIIVPAKVWEELLVLESDFGHDLSLLKEANWLEIRMATDLKEVQRLQQFLDAGESEAIVLAKFLHADFLLMDEQEGRAVAANEGLKTVGVLGVLVRAKKEALIHAIRPLLEDLRIKARFYIHERLFDEVLRLAGE